MRDVKQFRFGPERTYKVTEAIDAETLRLDTGLIITLLGIHVPPGRAEKTLVYLRRSLQGKSVIVKFDGPTPESGDAPLPAYVHLTNKLFVNRKMIEAGLAVADRTHPHKYREKFLAAELAATNESIK